MMFIFLMVIFSLIELSFIFSLVKTIKKIIQVIRSRYEIEVYERFYGLKAHVTSYLILSVIKCIACIIGIIVFIIGPFILFS